MDASVRQGFGTKRGDLFHIDQRDAARSDARQDMKPKQDRRVARTRQLLRSALFSLVREKGFEKLTVQEILDRANVGRATFYAHFDNKEDLLLSGFDELRTSLRQAQRDARTRGAVDESLFAFSREMVAHIEVFRDVYHAMAGDRSAAIVEHILHKLLIDLVRDEVKTLWRGDAGSVGAEARVQFVAGGLFGLLNWWLNGKRRVSMEEIHAIFSQLAIPVVKTRLR